MLPDINYVWALIYTTKEIFLKYSKSLNKRLNNLYNLRLNYWCRLLNNKDEEIYFRTAHILQGKSKHIYEMLLCVRNVNKL